MTLPDEALVRARESAARKRAEGAYTGVEPGGPLDATITSGLPSIDTMSDWAVIEVDPEVVFSTRRAGAPITAFKRLLLRLLRQYSYEVEAQQTRFNIALVSSMQDLERRVEALERGAEQRE